MLPTWLRHPRSADPDTYLDGTPISGMVGDETGPQIGRLPHAGTPVRLEPGMAYRRDNRPPVTALIGPPGSGKTVLMSALAAQLYADGRPLVCVTSPQQQLLPDSTLAAIEAPEGTPAPRQVEPPRLSSLDPQWHTDDDRAQLADFRSCLGKAIDALPVPGVLLIEEAEVLRLAGLSGGELLRRTAPGHARHAAIILSAQRARELTGWETLVTRFLLFGTDHPDEAADTLRWAGLEPSGWNVRQLSDMARAARAGTPDVLLCDVDGRCARINAVEAEDPAMVTPGSSRACPKGPHRGPEGPNEDLAQCPVCWSVSYVMRPDGETYGDHLPDCALPDPRHKSYCKPGGAGHQRAQTIRGYWPGTDLDD